MPDPKVTDAQIDAICARLHPLGNALALLALTLITLAVTYQVFLAILFHRTPA